MKLEATDDDRYDQSEFDRVIEQAYRELEYSRRIAQGIISNARDEASQLVAKAKTEAARLVAEARAQASTAQSAEVERQVEEAKHAYQQGFTSGLEKGADEGQRRFDAILTKVSGILEHLTVEREQMFDTYRQEMLDLVLKIAERVVRVEKETINNLLGENLVLLLEENPIRGEVALHLNPADVEEVSSYLVENGGPLPRHRLKSNPDVPAGECWVRGPELNLDLSFQRRFETIRDRLAERFGAGSSFSRRVDGRTDRHPGEERSAGMPGPKPESKGRSRRSPPSGPADRPDGQAS
ncbi:MAG: hypothetical protein HY815_24255 [Candidatus Riflebacteria bacterium]|nr:hypothetical protein [Candidatus Riflebacteria bacterium]